jgi:AcrR family transcriptional regulator
VNRTKRASTKADKDRTAERILSVTLRRIRRGGFASVSMRQVADELGITATALYHHFRNKDALLDRVAERIYDSVTTPDPALHWTARLRQLMLALEHVHLDYPGLARFLLIRRAHSPAAFRWMESILQVLSDGGLNADEMLFGLNELSFLINPLTLLDVPQRRSSQLMTFEPRASRSARALSAQLADYPLLLSLADRMAGLDYETQYAAALDGVIEVLEAHVDTRLAAARLPGA